MLRALMTGVLVFAVAVVSATQVRAFRVQMLGLGDVQLQESPVTCGPASLAYILRKKGIPADEGQVARLAGTTTSGTTLLGLARAAETLGATATGVSAPYQTLLQVELPAIAVFPDHFVVVTSATQDYVVVADPLVGVVKYGRKAFARTWTGQLLVLQWRKVE